MTREYIIIYPTQHFFELSFGVYSLISFVHDVLTSYTFISYYCVARMSSDYEPSRPRKTWNTSCVTMRRWTLQWNTGTIVPLFDVAAEEVENAYFTDIYHCIIRWKYLMKWHFIQKCFNLNDFGVSEYSFSVISAVSWRGTPELGCTHCIYVGNWTLYFGAPYTDSGDHLVAFRLSTIFSGICWEFLL